MQFWLKDWRWLAGKIGSGGTAGSMKRYGYAVACE
jgi:hypothetical protein